MTLSRLVCCFLVAFGIQVLFHSICFTTNHPNHTNAADVAVGYAPVLRRCWTSCWNALLEGKTGLDLTVLANEASEFPHSSFILSLIQSAGGGLRFSGDKAVDFFQRIWPHYWSTSSSHWSSHTCSKYEEYEGKLKWLPPWLSFKFSK